MWSLQQLSSHDVASLAPSPATIPRATSVFVVHPGDYVNLDQMVETLARDGYLVGQEYVTGGSTPAGL
jgi:hypothetical protein